MSSFFLAISIQASGANPKTEDDKDYSQETAPLGDLSIGKEGNGTEDVFLDPIGSDA